MLLVAPDWKMNDVERIPHPALREELAAQTARPGAEVPGEFRTVAPFVAREGPTVCGGSVGNLRGGYEGNSIALDRHSPGTFQAG